MQSRKNLRWPCGLLGALLSVAPSAFAQSKPAPKPAPKTKTGYVVSNSETALVLSNLAPRSGGDGPAGGPGERVFTRSAAPGEGGGAPGGGTQIRIGPGDVARGPDGKLSLSPEAKKRFTPEQARMIEQDLNSGPREGGMVIREGGTELRLGPGDVVVGPGGKRTLSPEAKKRFTPEQQRILQEALNNAGHGAGPVVIRRGPAEEGDAQAQPSKAPAPGAPLQLTDFVLDKKTKKPRDLSAGEKVKVTYVEADGKKLATRIEKAK